MNRRRASYRLMSRYRLRRIDKKAFGEGWEEWDEYVIDKNRSDLLSSNLKNGTWFSAMFDKDMIDYFDLKEAKRINEKRSNNLKIVFEDKIIEEFDYNKIIRELFGNG